MDLETMAVVSKSVQIGERKRRQFQRGKNSLMWALVKEQFASIDGDHCQRDIEIQ